MANINDKLTIDQAARMLAGLPPAAEGVFTLTDMLRIDAEERYADLQRRLCRVKTAIERCDNALKIAVNSTKPKNPDEQNALRVEIEKSAEASIMAVRAELADLAEATEEYGETYSPGEEDAARGRRPARRWHWDDTTERLVRK